MIPTKNGVQGATVALSFDNLHGRSVESLVRLGYGSFLSCSEGTAALRWESYDDGIQPVSSFGDRVLCAVATDSLLITGLQDGRLKKWNLATGECIAQIQPTFSLFNITYTLLISNDNTTLLCGLSGKVELRNLSDLCLISGTSRIDLDSLATLRCICELSDGTFVSGGGWPLRRWDRSRLLETLRGHSGIITRVIELQSNVIVTASEDTTIIIWEGSAGNTCLRNVLRGHSGEVNGLEKLSEGDFMSSSTDQTIRVWSSSGSCIKTIQTNYKITAMTTLRNGSVVIAYEHLIEVRAM